VPFWKNAHRNGNSQGDVIMNSPGHDLAVTLNASHAFKQYINYLPSSAWGQQSACDRWTVCDVIVHMVNVNKAFAAFISRGLQGIQAPPEGATAPGTLSASSAAEIWHKSVLSVRKRLGNEILSRFTASSDHLDKLLADLKDADWEKPCYHPAAIFPVRRFLNSWTSELVVHGWDIRSRLEPGAKLSADAVPLVLNYIPSFANWLFWPTGGLPEPVCYRFELNGPGSRDIDIVVAGGRVDIDKAGNKPSNVTFRCSTEIFVLMIYGRLQVEDLIASGKLLAEGPGTLTKDFGHMFKGA